MIDWESEVEETCREAWSGISDERISEIINYIREDTYKYIHNNLDEVVDLILNEEGGLDQLEWLVREAYAKGEKK